MLFWSRRVLPLHLEVNSLVSLQIYQMTEWEIIIRMILPSNPSLSKHTSLPLFQILAMQVPFTLHVLFHDSPKNKILQNLSKLPSQVSAFCPKPLSLQLQFNYLAGISNYYSEIDVYKPAFDITNQNWYYVKSFRGPRMNSKIQVKCISPLFLV